MDKQRETWDSISHPQTSTIYYVGRSTESPRPSTLYSAHDEHLHNMGWRTLEAYEFALNNCTFDYIARPHSSCYVHKRKLVEWIDTIPESNVFAGLETDFYGMPYLWGGGHYVISRDVIEKMIANKRIWDHTLMEDVAASKLATQLGIPFFKGKSCSINPANRGWDCVAYNGEQPGFSFTNFDEVNKLDQHFFRVKHDPDRNVDLQTMDLLFKHLRR